MSLSVLAAAAEAPQATALFAGGHGIAFAELALRVRRRIAWLRARLPAGSAPVALIAESDPATLELLYALFEIGAPAVLVHPRLPPAARRELLRPLGLSPLDPSPASAGAGAEKCPAAPADDERPLAVVHTSGTTGAPRWAELSRRAFVAAARASEANLGWEPRDRWLLALPFAHVGGLSIVTRCLLARRAVVLCDTPRPDAASIARTLERDRVTLLSLVPTQLARLLELRPAWRPPATLRAVLLGGAAASPRLLASAHRRGVPVLTSYGLTEACSQVTTQPYAARGRAEAGSGRALPGVEVRIVDGRIHVRSDALLTRFWPIESEPPPRDAQGFLVTADLGRLEPDGTLHVLGRADDVIVTGGENVAPLAVENVLEGCPAVRAAAVGGLPDPTFGQVLAAAVVVDPRARHALEQAEAWAAERLAPHERPRRWIRLDALPETAAGKLDRRALGRLLAGARL
jgi:O-succinylbenzoic acid--CoA ligase